MLATKEQAHRIALDLREAGRSPEQPGKFQALQGIGWWLEEQNMAQISFNLTDQNVTPLHVVYEEVNLVFTNIILKTPSQLRCSTCQTGSERGQGAEFARRGL